MFLSCYWKCAGGSAWDRSRGPAVSLGHCLPLPLHAGILSTCLPDSYPSSRQSDPDSVQSCSMPSIVDNDVCVLGAPEPVSVFCDRPEKQGCQQDEGC